MKKGKGVGIGVSVIIASIMIGIASLPDEVLLESGSLEASQGLLSEENAADRQILDEIGPVIPIELAQEEILPGPAQEETLPGPAQEETPIEPAQEEILPEPAQEETPIEPAREDTETKTTGKKIQVSVSDGVGAGDK